jgi:hypothetical protein
MKRYSVAFFTLFTCIISGSTQAQNIRDSSLFFPFFRFSYAVQIPGGDLARRFNVNSNVGLDFSIKTKSNFIVGVNGSFLFGDRIKEGGILDSIRTSTGIIINQNGNPAEVRLFERGFTVAMHVGKLFPVLSPNKNSGIVVYAGPVYMSHKIRIDDIGRQSPQLLNAYKKGYDRLTAGLGVQEYIGYMYMSNKRMLNFFFGFELMQGFTKSQRSYDYDLRQADTDKRIDMLSGFRIGWVLPLYTRHPQEFYYH